MNVLVVRQDNNGDVILAGPALRAIATHASHVTLLCGPSGRAAAECMPGVDEIICHEAGWIEARPEDISDAAVRRIVDDVRARNIERAVIFTSWHQSALPLALLLRMAGVPHVAAISDDYAGALLDVRHRLPSDDLHEVERSLSLARAAGFALPPADDARLRLRPSARANPASALGSYVVVHPGSTVPARAWSPQKNRELVLSLHRSGERVVVTGGAHERALCAAVAGREALDLGGRTDFATLARVIEDASGLVVGNTGAAHVAAAVGTPTVSIFAPTIPAARFRPWMVDHVLLGDQDIPCAGCRARVCPLERQACIDDVSVGAAAAALALVRREAVSA